jgi:hypothetical protein
VIEESTARRTTEVACERRPPKSTLPHVCTLDGEKFEHWVNFLPSNRYYSTRRELPRPFKLIKRPWQDLTVKKLHGGAGGVEALAALPIVKLASGDPDSGILHQYMHMNVMLELFQESCAVLSGGAAQRSTGPRVGRSLHQDLGRCGGHRAEAAAWPHERCV